MIGVGADFKAWTDTISGLIRKLNSREEALYPVAFGEMELDIAAQFAAGGTPAWTPLRPATIKAKARAGFPKLNRRGLPPKGLIQRGAFGPQNILIRTGALFSSYTNPSDPSAVRETSRDSVKRGSRIPYAAVHQYGAGKVPERAVVINPSTVDLIADRLLTKLMEGTT